MDRKVRGRPRWVIFQSAVWVNFQSALTRSAGKRFGASEDGHPSKAETRGLLGRLELAVNEPERIGKEIDRLDEDEGVTLEDGRPVIYGGGTQQSTLARAIAFLGGLPKQVVVPRLPISQRRWRDIKNRRVKIRAALERSLAARVSPRNLVSAPPTPESESTPSARHPESPSESSLHSFRPAARQPC